MSNQFYLKQSTQFSSILPIARAPSGATTPGQCRTGSGRNEGVFHIPQSSSITGTLLSDWLTLYPGHLLGESYLPLEVQAMYSTEPSRLSNCWFSSVLWHINPCRLFNVSSSLYIYIWYIWFCPIGFFGISIIVEYLMPNAVYTYIKYTRVSLVGFYGTSTIVCYLTPNLLYTDI